MKGIQTPICSTGIAVVLLKKINGLDKVLLLKRATPVFKDMWCYIGGSLEQGEQAWEAALREVKEETGITKLALYSSNTFDQIYSPVENYLYIAPVFVGIVEENQEVRLNNEHSEYKWLSFEEAKEFVTLPGNDEVLTFIEKHFIKKKPTEWLRIRVENVGE
ncbi:NUDIX domain-containing protein [Niallia circulans]|jgi:dihydroneopterin triphosphate diphosphatase|uniref:NUDIX hydrolase n=1 Tax=Niallia TaxID=2837506 RepID=UPI00069E7E57|nr:NUDIX domain-containing protein [Niallia circulans]MCM2982963.1 NUDIX domain-containing protein [Niallia circulans]MED5102578.1 NUDIX domain-containing protein [Niallia circulans]NRG31587.1 NUDIX domain-containing protein [Niallia circulans]PAD24224.1 NUDIX domain-containing protein [Niallia circulans]PAD86949.1 NUDIX domain-containing protein [Niallia circulans]